MSGTPDDASRGGLVLFKAPDGAVRIAVRLHGDTAWLTRAQMAELFGREQSVVTRHLQNVFREGELARDGNVQMLHILGAREPAECVKLDALKGSVQLLMAGSPLRDRLESGRS